MLTRIRTPPGVFEPHSDSILLAEALLAHRPAGRDVIDLCCGSGILAVTAAAAGARACATDVSRAALLAASANAWRNGVPLETRRGDLFSAVPGRTFDLIVSNPPYVPGEDSLPARGAARAWEGGSNGRIFLDRICEEGPRRLRSGGSILLVHSSLVGIEPTLDALRAAKLEATVIRRSRGPLGRLNSSRRRMLEHRGLLARGQLEEDVVVIRGSAA